MSRSKKSALLGPRQKAFLYAATALLWLSGAFWLYLHYFGAPEQPGAPFLLKLHGGAAMAFLLAFGALLHQHVPAGWNQNEQRPSGVTLVGACSLLVATGWGLYYIGHEGFRQWTSGIHSAAGLLLPALIWLHIRHR